MNFSINTQSSEAVRKIKQSIAENAILSYLDNNFCQKFEREDYLICFAMFVNVQSFVGTNIELECIKFYL